MKKAIITSGGKQYLVTEGDEVKVELLEDGTKKTISFEPLLVIDGAMTDVGNPTVSGAKVTADVIDSDTAGDKVLSIRYKSKKRVHKVRGHRQHHATLKITKIS